MLRELTLPELEVVSGGTDQSTVVSTGTRGSGSGWISISTEEARRLFGDNGRMSHLGGPHPVGGGGGTASPTAEEAAAREACAQAHQDVADIQMTINTAVENGLEATGTGDNSALAFAAGSLAVLTTQLDQANSALYAACTTP